MKQKLFSVLVLFVFLFVSVNEVSAQTAELTFEPTSVSVDTNEIFEVEIVFDTAGNEVGGVGAIIKYNTEYLQVTKTSPSDLGVTPGNIFSDYPKASFDNNLGEVYLSGIVANPNSLYTGRGVLGKVKFISLKAGSTDIVYEFTPGSTKDSNIAVTFGSGDILEKVTDLKVNISTTVAANNTIASTPPASSSTELSAQDEGILARILKFFKRVVGMSEEPEIDPYGSVSDLPPNTSPQRSQPTNKVAGSTSNNLLLVGILIVLTIIVALIVKFILSRRRQKGPTVIQKDIEL